MVSMCKHKVGLLSLRDCGDQAVSKCNLCNRPVCEKHQKTLSDAEEAICIECYLQRVDGERAVREDAGQYYYRRRVYHSSGYRPYYYGHSRHYKHDHYRDFDHTAEGEIETEDQLDPDDFQDS